MFKTLVHKKQKTLKNLKNEFVADDNTLNNVNELEILTTEDKTIEDMRNDLPGEIEKIAEALKSHI